MAIKPMQKSKAVEAARSKMKQPKGTVGGWQPKAKGGNSWGFSTSQAQLQKLQMDAYMQGVAAAKGFGKAAAKGFGKGRVGKPAPKPVSKWQEKLKKIDASKLVWVGGLSPKTTWKTLEKHFSEILKPTVSDIVKKPKGITAMLAYKSEEDVATVVAALNGSELDGQVLEVDVWQKSEKPEKEKKQEKRQKGKAKVSKVINTKFAKSVKPQDAKLREKLKAIEPSCKVWVGGLAEKTTWKALEKHFAEVIKPKVTDIMGKGKAVVAYENEQDAATAIAALNGSELEGKTLEVDTWVKPEKKEKQKKSKDEPKDE